MDRRWQRNAVFPLSAAARGALFLVLLTGAGFVGRAMALEDPPPCPKTKAVGHLAGVPQATPPTTTCDDGTPCGFIVTVAYNGWTCETIQSNRKCVSTEEAPQTVIHFWTCSMNTCRNHPTVIQDTMVGKKTEDC